MKIDGDNKLNSLDNDIMFSICKGVMSPLQALKLRVIKISIRDYLYFSLGDNGIKPEDFLDAYQYLFKVRANDLHTNDENSRCFDTHFKNCVLSDYIEMNDFLVKLKDKRNSLISSSPAIIKKHISSYRNREWKTEKCTGKKELYSIPSSEIPSLLISPDNEERVAQLFLYKQDKPLLTNKIMLQYKSLLF